jgi:signal transduction histidine kinase
MQEKLINYERVAAIHQTVVTLSDRINNPLTIIQGHAELLRKDIPDDDGRVVRSLDAILQSCQRCGEIMRKLREIQEPKVVEYAGTGLRMIDVERTNGGMDPDSPPLDREFPDQ